MSFNAKNLAYEAKEPSFLRNLKSQYGGSTRHERPISRPRKAMENDDDDEPTYVEEGSNDTITKEQYEKMLKAPFEESSVEAAKKAEDDTLEEIDSKKPSKKEIIGAIGAGAKKRTIKAVGNSEEQSLEEDPAISNSHTKKPRKKSKKIKLSFDEEN